MKEQATDHLFLEVSEMTKDSYNLTLDGEAMFELKHDFDNMLARTLDTMQQKNVNSASVTLRLEIDFPAGEIKDEAVFLFPMFKHKVSASMQLKSEKSGYFGGNNFKLVWDRVLKKWKMVRIDTEQMELDDSYVYQREEE